MDIIKFNNPYTPLRMEYGELVSGMSKIEWTERYRNTDDFKITAPISSGLTNTLPVGSFITHIDSDTVMVVENHEINAQKDAIPEVIISGRSLESILAYRVIGAASQWDNGPGTAPAEYIQTHIYPRWARYDVRSFDAVFHLLNEPMTHTSSTDSGDRYDPLFEYYFKPTTGDGFYGAWSNITQHDYLKSDEKDYLSNAYKFLEMDNFGMRIERPHRGYHATSGITFLHIHPGEDKTNSVVLSHDLGEIESANHLWSDKSYYNTVYIRTTWQAYMLKDPSITGVDRRTIYVDFPDIDAEEEYGDISYPHADVLAGCRAKAQEILGENKRTQTASVEIAKNLSNHKFRFDFKVGDLVMVDLGYMEPQVQRVVEYVEIQDEQGEIGYPILEAPNDKVYGYD